MRMVITQEVLVSFEDREFTNVQYNGHGITLQVSRQEQVYATKK